MPKYEPVTATELRTVVGPRSGVKAFHDVVVWHYHARGLRSGGIYNRRAVRGVTTLVPRTASLHASGRAADFMTSDKELHNELLLRFIRCSEQLGIVEVISWDRRWTLEKGLQTYRGKSPHRDHVHVGFSSDFASRANTPELKKWITHFLWGVD